MAELTTSHFVTFEQVVVGFSIRIMPNSSMHSVWSFTVIFRLMLGLFLQPLLTNRVACICALYCGCSSLMHVPLSPSTNVIAPVLNMGLKQERQAEPL